MLLLSLASWASCSQSPAGQSRPDPAPSSSPAAPADLPRRDDAGDTGGDGPGTEGLTAQSRTRLGLPERGQSAAQLQPLRTEQWADPEAVAVRFVLADSNYATSEDPATVSARRLVYATERLRADLAESSSGAAGRAELQDQGVVSEGEVLGVATTARSDDTAVVTVSVRRSMTANGAPFAMPRVGFYRLTLAPDQPSGRWLVARVELS